MLVYLLVFLSSLLVISLVGFFSSIRPMKFSSLVTPDYYGWDYETVAFSTRDNLLIKGWLIPKVAGTPENARRVVILLHGYPFDKGNILALAPFLKEKFPLLLFDFRYFGESGGSYTSVGYHEQKDLLAAVDFLNRKGYDKIGVVGFSLGGAVALMAAEKSPNIRAVVADSSYADLEMMAKSHYSGLFILKYPLTILTRLISKVVLGVDPKDVSPARAAEGSRTPILIIHSKDDDQIPIENAYRIKEALKGNPQAQFWFFDGARHGETFGLKRAEYEKIVLDFLEAHLR